MSEQDRPVYKNHVFVCTNERPAGSRRGCCKEKNAEQLRGYMKDRIRELGLPEVRINSAGCLDRCEMGPVMVIYPEGVWYTYKTEDDIEDILRDHLMDGVVVDRLKLDPDQNELKPDQQ